MHIHRTKTAIAGASLCAAFYFAQSWIDHADQAEKVMTASTENTQDDIRDCDRYTARMFPPKPFISDFMNGCLLSRVNFAKAEKVEAHKSAEFRDMFLAAALGALSILIGIAAVGLSRKTDQKSPRTPN